MNDKERLNEIITRYKNVKPFEIYSDTGIISMIQMDEKDKDWFIEQAEKVEQLQQEIASLKEALNESVKTSVALDNELQQAQKRIQYLENELRNCGYSDTDLDNDFLWEFQDKQVGWEEE
ncbi:hypothetical protein [Anoxybacillus sp. LAT_26]|uniref:hypothetical protein n=1 Tax=Anoxybacillus TaxID=150247 RepID=UPI001EEC68AD|nr:hypothetical protein [Anoxybacillus sp. LAT_26]MCG6183306.1 hypothetical protein [Anoxybacillus sp. LAT_26]MCG6199199.1 hypothetical protein [Anoxybacillus sp. LAT_38]